MHAMHAWLTVQMLWQMHGRTLQAVHKLIVCMRIFISGSLSLSGDCMGLHGISHMIVDCIQSMHISAHIVTVHHSVTAHSW